MSVLLVLISMSFIEDEAKSLSTQLSSLSDENSRLRQQAEEKSSSSMRDESAASNWQLQFPEKKSREFGCAKQNGYN
jgi:flagellar biosynthesis chaperone FliJ